VSSYSKLTWNLEAAGVADDKGSLFRTAAGSWFAGTDPTFTPVMRPEGFGEAIANAKRIASPPA
jgi:hypothetical protein